MFEGIEPDYVYHQLIEIIENYLLVRTNLIELIIFLIMIFAAYFLSKITATRIEELLKK